MSSKVLVYFFGLLSIAFAQGLLNAPNAQGLLNAPNTQGQLNVPNAQGVLNAPNSQGILNAPDSALKFQEFQTTFNKNYNVLEKADRFKVFNNNLKMINDFNNKDDQKQNYKLGLNEYSDMSYTEFQNKMLGMDFNPTNGIVKVFQNMFGKTNDSVDWRQQGVVAPVKDQGQCGSCWAFSANGALESQIAIQKKVLTTLSEQNLVDCSRNGLNNGCNGGLMHLAYEYIKDNKGINTEAFYPYVDKQGPCKYDASNIGGNLTGYLFIQENDNALMDALTNIGPIAVGVDASSLYFQFYKGGIYESSQCEAEKINHAVLLIGYGSNGNTNYWIIKNSWGESWGENGYMRIKRDGNNYCGIATYAVYPTIN